MCEFNKYIQFLGPVRTGHTLIASLLSFHKKIGIGIETKPNIFKCNDFSRDYYFDNIRLIFQI